MKNYVDKALELGFSEVKYLEDLSLECRADLRAYCMPEQCPLHGENWVCPPACGTLAECASRVQDFDRGFLLQSISKVKAPLVVERFQAINEEHNFRFKDFVEFVKEDFIKILPLTSGGCVFCESCSYPEPCIKPEIKMEALSAFGIDVGELCKTAGLDYSFRDDIVYLIALLLIDEKGGTALHP